MDEQIKEQLNVCIENIQKLNEMFMTIEEITTKELEMYEKALLLSLTLYEMKLLLKEEE